MQARVKSAANQASITALMERMTGVESRVTALEAKQRALEGGS